MSKMRLPRRGLVMFVVGSLLLGCAVSAHALSGVIFSPGGAMTQSGTFRVGSLVECPITLSGSLASTLVSISEGIPSVGSLTGLRSGTCSRGSISAVLNLPSTVHLGEPSSSTPAGSVGRVLYESNIGIRVSLSGGGECLLGGLVFGGAVEALGNNEYALGREEFASLTECRGVFPLFALGAPNPRQVATFLPGGGETINGFTPNPVVFGTVGVGELVQRTVTVGSSAGGRIEEIVVTTQRYFAITDPNGCRGRTLEARGTCNINVILSAPAESGRSISDTLTVRIAETRFSGTLRAST